MRTTDDFALKDEEGEFFDPDQEVETEFEPVKRTGDAFTRDLLKSPGPYGTYTIKNKKGEQPIETLQELVNDPTKLLDDYVESIEKQCSGWTFMTKGTVEQCDNLLGLAQQRVEQQQNKRKIANLRLDMLLKQWGSIWKVNYEGIQIWSDKDTEFQNLQMARTIIAVATNAEITEHEALRTAMTALKTITMSQEERARKRPTEARSSKDEPIKKKRNRRRKKKGSGK